MALCQIGSGDVSWNVVDLPADKAERERLIAELFVAGFERYVAQQSEPSLAPFGPPEQNIENDLDFAVETAVGRKLMELAEFAPLDAHGPTFEVAPTSLDPKAKAPLAMNLIQRKSEHQGGPNRFLVLYTTEHGFWLDPMTIERLRRTLSKSPPSFERVYSVSLHDARNATVSEVYPGAIVNVR